MSSEIALRPHHGLCLNFFRGQGYSGEFCRSMAAVLASLTPETAVRPVEGHDVLCAHCPNRCAPCPNAADYDRRVLALCGLTAGQALTWGAFQAAIRENILVPGRLSAVCGSCQWAPLCQEQLLSEEP